MPAGAGDRNGVRGTGVTEFSIGGRPGVGDEIWEADWTMAWVKFGGNGMRLAGNLKSGGLKSAGTREDDRN